MHSLELLCFRKLCCNVGLSLAKHDSYCVELKFEKII